MPLSFHSFADCAAFFDEKCADLRLDFPGKLFDGIIHVEKLLSFSGFPDASLGSGKGEGGL
jgi:hypothetical protein